MGQPIGERLADLRQRISDAEANDQTATALELLEIYIRLNPDTTYYRFLYGENLRALGRIGEAKSVLLSIGRVPATHAGLLQLSLGKLYEDSGKFAEAEPHYRAAVELDPSSTVPWVYLGGLLSKSGRINEAVDVFQAGLNAEGDLDEVYFNLGNCHRALRDYESAARCYQSALRLDPAYSEAINAYNDIISAQSVSREVQDQETDGGKTRT